MFVYILHQDVSSTKLGMFLPIFFIEAAPKPLEQCIQHIVATPW